MSAETPPSLDLAALRALLRAHRPADASERRSLERIVALLETPAPTSRRQVAPGHLTASAVVVDPERRRTLLIHHAKLGMWLQPGGHLEPDDADPAAGARREALEETGLAAEHPAAGPRLLDVDVHPIPAREDEPAHEHFDLRFLLVAPLAAPRAGEGTRAARWATAEEARALGLDPGLARALAKVALAT